MTIIGLIKNIKNLKGFGQNNHDKKIYKKSVSPPIDEIIDYAIKLQLKGNISEATKYYKYCIDKGNKDPREFYAIMD